MVRNQRVLLIPLAALMLFLAVYFHYTGQKQTTPPPRKPVPEKQNETSQSNAKWFIEFSVKEQKFTAYTEAVNAPVSSAGREYFIGSGAVHPRYPLQYGGEARSPIIPFG